MRNKELNSPVAEEADMERLLVIDPGAGGAQSGKKWCVFSTLRSIGFC